MRNDTKLVTAHAGAERFLTQQLEAIIGGGHTRRFHTVNTIQTNSVGHHSFGVALLCYFLTGRNPSRQLLMAALTHDMAEQFTGDMPAPAKRAMGIRESFGAIEEHALQTLHLSFPLDSGDSMILKMADVLDGMLFCITERRLGNVGIEGAYNNFRGYAVGVLSANGVAYDEHDLFNAIDEMWRSCHE